MPIKFRKLSSLFITLLLTISLLSGCNQTENVIQKSNSNLNVESTNTNLKEYSINIENLKNIIEELSSEKYNGRLSGFEGNKLAEDYIINHFNKIGLKNPADLQNYSQNFSMRVRKVNNTPKLDVLSKEGKILKQYRYLKDFTVITTWPNMRMQDDITAPLYIYEDLETTTTLEDVKGKIAMVPEDLRKTMSIETFARQTITACLSGDMIGVISESSLAKKNWSSFGVAPNILPFTSINEKGPIVFYADTPVYNEIVEQGKKGASVRMSIDCSIEDVSVNNIIGYIPGSDENLSSEFIILGAHLDHVGNNKDGTYNPGAFDNGSGIASLMEIARVLKEKNIQPKKSILFIAFNGEEEGLYGSRYYTEHPLFPLEKSILINMDMVGSKTVLPLSIYVVNEENTNFQKEFIKHAEELNIPTRKKIASNADHAPFGEKGIQAITLIHEDFAYGYHSPADTPDKVDLNRLKEVGDLVLHYVNKIAY